jgi:arylsulfatase A-like enzyme
VATRTRSSRTLDPGLGYHYGAALGDTAVESGDDLTLEVPTPPQVARHEGYETAFVDMAPVEVSL